MKPVLLLLALAVPALPAPAAHAQHGPGGHNRHTESPTPSRPLDGEAAALRAQLEQVRAATARYRDIRVAEREGWKRFGRQEGPLMGEHWYLPDRVDAPFDVARPSTLQYASIGGRKVLVGVAYTVYRRPGDPLPAGFAGQDDHWHTHDVARLGRALTEGRPVLRWLAEHRAGQRASPARAGRTHLTMVHAWVWLPNPDGIFAQHHRAMPYLRAGLPAAWAEGGSEAAAQGIALLAPGACRGEAARVDALARLDGGQTRQLLASCDRSAAEVQRAYRARTTAAVLNREAGAAWSGYAATLQRVLRPDQKERLGSVMEHEAGTGGHMH